MQSSSTPSTIGIVTAFEQEFDAVVSCLQLTQSLNCPGSFPYLTGDLFGYKLVVTKCYKQGSVHSALATYELIRDCQPILVALLGIAGGLEKGLKVGDVVIPHSIWAYEYGKTIGERTAPEPRPYELLSTELQLIADRMQGSGAVTKTDVMASGCKVVASSQFRDSLRRPHRKMCAIEMESEGVAVAARRCNTPVIVIKGISDFADETTKGKIPKRKFSWLPNTWRFMGRPARDRAVTEEEEPKHQVRAACNAANAFRTLLERPDFQKLYPPNKPEFQPRVRVPEVSAGATDEQLIRATAKDASVRIGNVDLQSQFFPRELWDEQVDRASSRNLFVDNSEQPNRIIIHLDELKRLPPERVADLKEQMLIESAVPQLPPV